MYKNRLTIGVVVNNLNYYFTETLCKGITEVAKSLGVGVVFIPGQEFDVSFYKYEYQFNSLYSYISDKSIDGVIATAGTVLVNAKQNTVNKFLNIFENVPTVFVHISTKIYQMYLLIISLELKKL